MRLLLRPMLVALALSLAAPLHAQAVLPDSIMNAVRAAAHGCEVTNVQRIAGDTVVVTLLDSTLTQTRWEDVEWTLCGGAGTGASVRDVSRAIVQPLWAAWPRMSPAKTATLDIRSPAADSIRVRLSFPQSDAPAVQNPQGDESTIRAVGDTRHVDGAPKNPASRAP